MYELIVLFVIIVVEAVDLPCGRDFGVYGRVVLGDGGIGSLLERGYDGWARNDMRVGDLGPERNAVVSRSVLFLYGFCGVLETAPPVNILRANMTYHQCPQTFGLRR